MTGLAYWGCQTGINLTIRLLLAVGVPVLAAAIWGRFVAPKAPHRLEDPARVAVEITIFAGATAALGSAGAAASGACFGILSPPVSPSCLSSVSAAYEL
jgi:hypothetical protein